MPISPTYLHKRGHSQLFLVMRSWLRRGVVFWCVAGRRLRGIGPALAGNVGTGSAFARPRDGDQGVDVPMLAPARSRSAWRICGLRGIGPALARKARGEDGVFALCARGGFDRFQRSLRPGPASDLFGVMGGEGLVWAGLGSGSESGFFQ